MIQKVKLTTRTGKKVVGSRITVSSDLPSNIENIWTKIQDVNTLRELAKPKANFISCGNSPIIWKEGNSYVFKLFLHGFISVGEHTITEEYNKTVIIWNHSIKMEEVNSNVTRYTDTVDLYAGSLISFTAWWALKFYQQRQRKWQKIVIEH